jgi:ATP/maltotriose-dependent transcriptional regulator MalT
VDRASVLRERVRIASLNGKLDNAAEALTKLEALASSSGDVLVQSIYESAREYLSCAKGDYDDAVGQLAGDSHSALALQQLAVAQEKLGDTAVAQLTRAVLKYRRSPTAEWFLVEHSGHGNSR